MENILEDLKAQELLEDIQQYMKKDVSFLDALEHYCFKNQTEPELVGEVVRKSKVLMARAQEEGEQRLLVEKTVRLPI
jgi:hypothetical protein